MKATKIMGAVLVALLAAALFVGAGAADTNYGTHFVYENTTASGANIPDGTYIYGTNSVVIENGIIKAGESFLDGATYTKKGANEDSLVVKYPTGTVEITLYNKPSASVIDGTVPNSASVNLSVTSPVKNFTRTENAIGLIFTDPKGTQTTFFAGKDWKYDNTTTWTNPDNIALTSVMTGTWKVNAYFNASSNFSVSMPEKYQIGQKTFTFTVSDVAEKITADADSVTKSNVFKITLTGTPGNNVNLTANKAGLKVVEGQINVKYNTSKDLYENITQVTIGDAGTTVVSIKAAGDDGSYKITANFTKNDGTYTTKDVKISVKKGTVTIVPAAESYYIGQEVKLSGTNTQSDKVQIYVKGTNTQYIFIDNESVKSDNTWDITIDKDTFLKYDAGTYTFYAVAKNEWLGANVSSLSSDEVYESASVALKQPFLTATASASVVPQKSKLTISGSAEATSDIMWYVFGNNKFASRIESVEDDGSYSFEIEVKEDEFGTGQYFVVIQHPMYDKTYNVGPVESGSASVGNKKSYNIMKNRNGVYTAGSIQFNTLDRQSSNGAQALCDELDDQSIDDIYVKLTFIVGTPVATLNPVSDVVKGSTLKVSGTTNVAAGKLVTVDMLSTAFAAIPKESVNSASFITLTTKVVEGKDGVNTWEVVFDTTGLNVDEYTISATVEGVATATTTVKVIEGTVTPTAQPTGTATAAPTTTTVPTTTPTKTPGFGALVALAGLGAVAVLLLRRE